MLVRVTNNLVDRAIKELKRKLIREGLFKDLSKKRYFLQPSERKKKKREEAEKRRQKDRKRAIRNMF